MKTVVVGAGPVGALAGLYAARRGHHVEIYELRGDLRDASTVPLNFTKSINLALSERGINSMRKADSPELLEAVMDETIPMHGRMIHGENNGQLFEQSQLYDAHGRYIRAVDRGGLNKHLLDELEKMPNVHFYFNHRLTGADFKRNFAWFEQRDPLAPKSDLNGRGREVEVSFDLLIGADGAHSVVRYNLMKFARMSYQQEYIDTLWCEFQIPPSDSSSGPEFKLHPNRLHIWPGYEFMFIAIPSLDKTFTSTLFMPESIFTELDDDTSGKLVEFFKTNFPGVVPDLISEDDLVSQYRRNPHLPLISIKCTPYHFGSSAVVVGDAAHAMVPFYGQGMNAGLEDVRVLFDTIDKHTVSSNEPMNSKTLKEAMAQALKEYTQFRTPDAFAINDLALGNYQEMRSDVVNPLYKLRKWVEEWVSVHVPSTGWATQYARVSFGNWRYSEVNKAAVRQKRILQGVMGVVFGATAVSSILLLSRSGLGKRAMTATVGLMNGI